MGEMPCVDVLCVCACMHVCVCVGICVMKSCLSISDILKNVMIVFGMLTLKSFVMIFCVKN